LNEIWKTFIASKGLSFDITCNNPPPPEAQFKNLKWHKGSSNDSFEVLERTLEWDIATRPSALFIKSMFSSSALGVPQHQRRKRAGNTLLGCLIIVNALTSHICLIIMSLPASHV